MAGFHTNLTDGPYMLHCQSVAATVFMFLEPAVQYVGIHQVLSGQRSNGNPGLLARGHQFRFEFWRAGPVGASG